MNLNVKIVPLLIVSTFLAFSCGLSNKLRAQDEKSIISSFEEKDLELFGSLNNSHEGFYQKLDRTRTTIGKQELKNQLALPTADIQELHKKQQLINWFCQHPEQHQKLQNLLQDFELFSYGLLANQQLDTLTEEVLKNFYYRLPFLESLNKSPLALDILNLMHGASLLSPVVEHLILHFALEFIQEKFTHQQCNHEDHHDHHNHHDRHHNHHHCLGHIQADDDASMLIKSLFWGIRLAHLGVHLFSVKEMIEHIGTRLNVMSCLYKKISACAYSLKALHAIYTLLQENTELLKLFDGFEKIKAIYEISEQNDLHEFITLLSGSHFSIDQELNFFSSVGKTLRAQQLMHSALEQLKPAVQAVAQLDCFASCATFYQELAIQEKCCFAQFIDQDKPYLEIIDGWNAMLDPVDAVPCSIACDDHNISKIILTGPNKAGKSTFMKGVALNILLAQTLGICAAKRLIIKPFHQIITYINIADDIANNQSMFAAEIIRADQCIARIKALADKESAFILIDDSLFKSTNPEYGQRTAYDFVEQLANYDTTIAFVATHLPLLTTLEQQHPSIFKNYKIKLTQDMSGNLASTFTLESGISDSNNAFILL